MTKRKLRKELSAFSKKSEIVATLYSGSLGIYIGGTQYVDVPNRPGFVYVRLRNNISELIQAHNETVSPVYGLPVLLIRNKTYYEIYGRDTVQYGSYWDSSSSYLPKHGHQHEFDPDNNGGGDLVFVHGEQFYPMMTFPSGSDGSNTVLIAPYRYFYSSAWHYTGNTGVGNLLTYGPTGANNAKLLLVGVDATTGNPFIKQGSEFSENITGAAALTSYVPTNITQSTEIPGAIIRLVTGTQTITWANIYDARQYMGILQAGGVTTFLGLTDTPSSYAGQANKFVSVKGDESGLEFVTSSPGGGGSGVVVYDDNVFKVTGTAISFDSNLAVVVTGSVAYVSASGGGSSTGTYFDGIQETFFPTRQVSNYTGSFYYFDANAPDNGTELDSPTFGVGNDQFAFAWITKDEYDLKNWLLRGEYTFFMFPLRSAGSHPMTAYAKLYEEYSGTETELAVSSLATDINGSTAIPTGGPNGFAFRMKLENNVSMYAGPTYVVDTTSRLLLKIYVNVAAGGSDGFIKIYPDNGYYFNVNLQRQVLDNHYLTGTSSVGGGGGTLGIYGRDEGVGLGTGTTLNVVGSDISLSISGTVLTLLHSDPTGTPHSFLDLTDTPDTYSGQGSKYVAVNSGATALEFVTAPAGGSSSNLIIYDDGVYKATGTSISFDANLTVIASGTSVFVAGAASGGGGGSGLVVYDDSVYKVTGTAISFDSNLSVAVTGSVAYISSSGAGAATTNEYVTTAAASDLSAEVAIPGLAGSADIAGAAGAGTSEEYDTSTTGLTWSPSTPNTVDSDTTIKSYLYIKSTDATERFGIKAWVPGAGAFDARAKISIGSETVDAHAFGMHIQNSDASNRTLLQLIIAAGGTTLKGYTYASSSYTQRGSTVTVACNAIYLRTTRDGSNNVSFYYSMDGLAWVWIATQALTFTVSHIGYRVAPGASSTMYGIVDWLRTSV